MAVIADDLTGALDASAPFARAPGGVAVATGLAAFGDALSSGAAVVAVSTRSRDLPPADARDKVARVLAALPEGVRVVKKIDSRLKGNIAAELEPFGDRPLTILPAIPDFGRIVSGGALQGFGVEIPIAVRSRLGHFGAAADIPDTATQAEIEHVVAGLHPEAVVVGARGLTQALAKRMGLAPPGPSPALPQPVCFLVGSTDPITLAQAETLRKACPGLAFVPAPAGVIPGDLRDGAAITLIQATPGDRARPDDVAAALARGALPCLRAAKSMLLTGGATAEATLDMLEITLLVVEGEAMPGMVRCRAGDQVVVTKSGGFGSSDAFVKCVRHPKGNEV